MEGTEGAWHYETIRSYRDVRLGELSKVKKVGGTHGGQDGQERCETSRQKR